MGSSDVLLTSEKFQQLWAACSLPHVGPGARRCPLPGLWGASGPGQAGVSADAAPRCRGPGRGPALHKPATGTLWPAQTASQTLVAGRGPSPRVFPDLDRSWAAALLGPPRPPGSWPFGSQPRCQGPEQPCGGPLSLGCLATDIRKGTASRTVSPPKPLATFLVPGAGSLCHGSEIHSRVGSAPATPRPSALRRRLRCLLGAVLGAPETPGGTSAGPCSAPGIPGLTSSWELRKWPLPPTDTYPGIPGSLPLTVSPPSAPSAHWQPSGRFAG